MPYVNLYVQMQHFFSPNNSKSDYIGRSEAGKASTALSPCISSLSLRILSSLVPRLSTRTVNDNTSANPDNITPNQYAA